VDIHDAGSQAIRSLVDTNANTLSMATSEGRLPLHLLLDKPRPDHKLLREVIEKIQDAGGIKVPQNGILFAMIAAARTTNVGSDENQKSREDKQGPSLCDIYVNFSSTRHS
jgi:hypothetical protein